MYLLFVYFLVPFTASNYNTLINNENVLSNNKIGIIRKYGTVLMILMIIHD